MHTTPHVVLFEPEATREYGIPEVYGPFTSEALANDYIDTATVTDGWTATALPLNNAFEDDQTSEVPA